MKTRAVWIGKVKVGGGAPVSIQSMTKTEPEDIKATVRQIRELEELGCQIIRLAIPRLSSAVVLSAIKKQIHIPIEADIHFNPKLALESIKQGVDSVRLNPGNLTDRDAIKEIVKQAKHRHIPIRVGVNSGSVGGWRKKQTACVGKKTVWSEMVDAALSYSRYLESLKFKDIMISLKASDVPATVRAYRRVAELSDYPLHLGITAAGPAGDSIVKSAIGIGALLLDGIGDTIRVSVTGPPHDEIRIARQILEAVGLRRPPVEIISCPTCGRCEMDLIKLTTDVKRQLEVNDKELSRLKRPLKVALMGCVVNGPGEARDADIGIAGGKDSAFLFRHGKKIRKISSHQITHTILDELGLKLPYGGITAPG